jgi:hypothetical protein
MTHLKKDHRLQIQFDKQMVKWLATEAARRRVSVAQVVRDLVLAAMEGK